MKGCWLLLVLVLQCAPLLAQETLPGAGPAASQRQRELPVELAAIRARQVELQAATGVELHMLDDGRRSVTRIQGVPPEFDELEIRSPAELQPWIEVLYPYLGFSGTESLVFRQAITPDSSPHSYYFGQTINGMALINQVVVHVNVDSGKVLAVRGNVQLDRGFAAAHALDAAAAMALVREFARSDAGLPELAENPRDEANLLYREWGADQALAPWWAVHLYGVNSWLIDPEGMIHDGVVVTP